MTATASLALGVGALIFLLYQGVIITKNISLEALTPRVWCFPIPTYTPAWISSNGMGWISKSTRKALFLVLSNQIATRDQIWIPMGPVWDSYPIFWDILIGAPPSPEILRIADFLSTFNLYSRLLADLLSHLGKGWLWALLHLEGSVEKPQNNTSSFFTRISLNRLQLKNNPFM